MMFNNLNFKLVQTIVYISAIPAEDHIDTWQTLRKVAGSARCLKPDVNSNSLYQYTATVCQVCVSIYALNIDL